MKINPKLQKTHVHGLVHTLLRCETYKHLFFSPVQYQTRRTPLTPEIIPYRLISATVRSDNADKQAFLRLADSIAPINKHVCASF